MQENYLNNLPPGSEKLLRRRQKLFPDVLSASPAKISEFNTADLTRRSEFKRLYRPSRKTVMESFIIPVGTDQVIGGYLFRNIRKKEDIQNSLIVYLHDGGWVLGNMDICCAVCSNICDVTGATVLAIDYRLAPANKFPIPVEDCYNAYIWAAQGARYWRADPTKIYLMGSCSGANLAAAVCHLARDRKVSMPAGLILVDPITDCRLRTDSIEKYKDNPLLSGKQLAFYISNYMREPKDILDPLFSPLLALDHSRLPETLILAAESDPLFDDAQLYANALSSADTPCKFIECKGRLHGMLNFPSAYHWKETMEVVTQFVNGRSVSLLNL